MTKNISEMTLSLLRSIAAQVEDLPPPKDYFRGRMHSSVFLPDNVLLFVRRETYDLNRDSLNVFHDRNVLLIPLSGAGRVAVNGKVFHLEPGKCLFIAPYQFHHYRGVQTRDRCWLFITFDGEAPIGGNIYRIAEGGAFANDLGELVRCYRRKKKADAESLSLRLALMLAKLRNQVSNEKSARSTRDESLLLRAHRLMLENLGSPLSLSDMARRLGLSASALRARLRKSTGYSPVNLQLRLRLMHAARMLRKTGAGVAETARACGWDSPFSFSRSFAAYWGVPPKRFSMGGGQSTRQKG